MGHLIAQITRFVSDRLNDVLNDNLKLILVWNLFFDFSKHL